MFGRAVLDTILIIDDDQAEINKVKSTLQNKNNYLNGVAKEFEFSSSTALDTNEVLSTIDGINPTLLMLDLIKESEGPVGQDITKAVAGRYPGLPIILITRRGSEQFEQAIEAIRNGASQILYKDDFDGVYARGFVKTVCAVIDEADRNKRREILKQFLLYAAITTTTIVQGTISFAIGNMGSGGADNPFLTVAVLTVSIVLLSVLAHVIWKKMVG